MRLHVSITVHDVAEAMRFYSTLFGAEPALVKEDYAKWELADPPIHFSVSTHGSRPGLDHLGLQLEDLDQLKDITGRLTSIRLPVLEQENAACCYARSNKTWVTDPAGLSWEMFHSFEQTPDFGSDRLPRTVQEAAAVQPCCGPGKVRSDSTV
jgi:catechol 2,3-dioxygenase-like lactoylglutathione lyase family enzyme